MKANCSNENIIQNLKDAGCDKYIELFMNYYKNDDKVKENKLLEEYRKHLLYNLHKNQKQIDCLDYLIYIINKNKI